MYCCGANFKLRHYSAGCRGLLSQPLQQPRVEGWLRRDAMADAAPMIVVDKFEVLAGAGVTRDEMLIEVDDFVAERGRLLEKSAAHEVKIGSSAALRIA